MYYHVASDLVGDLQIHYCAASTVLTDLRIYHHVASNMKIDPHIYWHVDNNIVTDPCLLERLGAVLCWGFGAMAHPRQNNACKIV